MSTATVSDRGQVVIPAEIRRLLGIAPGTRLDFTIEGQSLRVEVARRAAPSRLEDGYGLLITCALAIQLDRVAHACRRQ